MLYSERLKKLMEEKGKWELEYSLSLPTQEKDIM